MIKNVTVAGSGVLGSQIAFQIAFKGFNVTVYDINDDVLAKAKTKMIGLEDTYQQEIAKNQQQFTDSAKGVKYNSNLLPHLNDSINALINKSIETAKTTPSRISYQADLANAVSNADLVIEAIPEREDIKQNFYEKLARVAPKKAIFTTNSSTLVPSQFAEYTGRPDRFLAMHFANEIWINNTAEVMGHAGTDPAVFNEIIQFAKDIGMLAIPVRKEQPGYILNSVLVPFLDAAEMLYLDGVGDPELIDKTWMKATGAPAGPFGILDIVGITTAYNIILNYAATTGNEKFTQLGDLLKTQMIDQGKLGVATGEGFYKYPNPAYKDANFLDE
ncbi:3-hydroxyacyl-CoA dehydrogenase [Secundilactobacillus folii]|uniref:3-hydroxyacyl-CoA dehydrogenase n=1 Tax=Secundilactobacillus folii TaxID=2678357 RepID=A0A7X2XTY2_9LACO|nr:3-hydroxyacyl-CoA dehydrogenase [Secundilactobacillus folii]MTV81504.1 3-hydroxyacyl-CoA dehydrogenase [Secundilactobacillus folii]